MDKLKLPLPKILVAITVTGTIGLAIFYASQIHGLKQEISTLKKGLQEKSEDITRLQEALGKEVAARNFCESSLSSSKEELAVASRKLESAPLPAGACKPPQRKHRK